MPWEQPLPSLHKCMSCLLLRADISPLLYPSMHWGLPMWPGLCAEWQPLRPSLRVWMWTWRSVLCPKWDLLGRGRGWGGWRMLPALCVWPSRWSNMLQWLLWWRQGVCSRSWVVGMLPSSWSSMFALSDSNTGYVWWVHNAVPWWELILPGEDFGTLACKYYISGGEDWQEAGE